MFAAVSCLMATAAPLSGADAVPAAPDLARASWVWASPRGATDGEFACLFRRAFDLPSRPSGATVLVTADNGYDLFVNGSLVGGDSGIDAVFWSSVEMYRIEHLLAPGRNVIAVRGENLGGPAGLLAAARVELTEGSPLELFTDASWRVASEAEAHWTTPDYPDGPWQPAAVLGTMGIAPWGRLVYPGPASPGSSARSMSGRLTEPGADFDYPEGIVFLRGRVPFSSDPAAPQAVWPIGGSRAYLENDTPGPVALGRELLSLVPARPGGRLTSLVNAGRGLIGSPSVSHDGKTMYFSMAPDGEPFFHVYRAAADGNSLERLTQGTFHDFDPQPLPDGRIVFSSTRTGSREEYHGNAARSLFTMNADGTGIRPLTHHIVADVEPVVTAGGEVAFIRCDNFMERAKVETQIHAVRPDGTGGRVLFGANREAIAYGREHAAESDSRWLRSYGYGSLAPLEDGRVACISSGGLIVTGSGPAAPETIPTAVSLFDISPLPGGSKLLCTVASRGAIGVLDLDTGEAVRIHASDTFDIHSAVFLGPRPRPPLIAGHVSAAAADDVEKTGFLLCQNIFYTKQTQADLARVKAVRVIEAVPFTNRPARHPYAHIGVEAVELGTAPLWPDGSFYVQVPADRALAIQAVDAEGRCVLNEMTWIYVRPGEQRTCAGCHEPKGSAPENRSVLALGAPPVPLLGRGDPHRFRGNNAANGGVLNLQFDRFREAASVNLHAGIDARPASVQGLCGALSSGTEEEMISAARRLAIFRDRAAVPALLAALKQKSAAVRLDAAFALSSCGTREAVDGLRTAVADRSAAVARAARIALENITGRDEPATPAAPVDWDKLEADLIARLDPADPVVLQKAIEALGHVGGDAARRALRSYVSTHRDGSLPSLLAAMRALGQLRDAEAVPLLAGILEANIGEKPADAPQSHEFGWLQKPIHLAAAAAEAMGWIGTPAASEALIAAYPKLQPFWYYTFRSGDHSWLMGCHVAILHYRIAEALDAMGAKNTAAIVPALLRSIPIDTDRALLFELDSYETLVGRVVRRSGLAPEVLETCLSVLGDCAARPSEKLIDGVTASPPAESVGPLGRESRAAQVASIVCLGASGTAGGGAPDAGLAVRLRAAFDRFRAEPPSRERSWAGSYLARALGTMRDPGSVASLLAALDEEPPEASFGLEAPPNVFTWKAMTPFHRAAAAHALGSIGDARAVPSLLKTLESFDNALDVRHAAARAARALASRPASAWDRTLIDRLDALAAGYPEASTRRVLLEAARSLHPERRQGKVDGAKSAQARS